MTALKNGELEEGAPTVAGLRPRARRAPVIAQCAIQDGGVCALRFTGEPLARYQLETSTRLLEWIPAAEAVADQDGAGIFLDTTLAVHPHRFYRLLDNPD
jgi:hypothetical protein